MLPNSKELSDNLIAGGYITALQEALLKFLSDSGFVASLHDSLYAYLEQAGYPGELNHKIYLWSLDNWVLGGLPASSFPFALIDEDAAIISDEDLAAIVEEDAI